MTLTALDGLETLSQVQVAMSIRREGSESPYTRKALNRLNGFGVGITKVEGITDIALARNHTLTEAMSAATPNVRYILMVDSDIDFTVMDVLDCVESIQTQPFAYRPQGDTMIQTTSRVPVGKIYIQENGRFCGCRITPNLYLMGLGFLLVEVSLLHDLMSESVLFTNTGSPVYEFTQCRTINGEWYSEDYFLTRRLGGVRVIGGVGHDRSVPLRPNAESLAKAVATSYDGPFFGSFSPPK